MLKKIRWRKIAAEFVSIAGIVAIFLVFRTTAYAMYHIPSESMLPTLAVGDRIVVSKFAYGYSRHSVPFSLAPDLPTPNGRIFARLPERGDIVVFKHPDTRETYVKRVIGLPGDEVSIAAGRLYLNGAPAPRRLEEAYRYRQHRGGIAEVGLFTERLPDGPPIRILERSDYARGDEFGPAVVPDDHLFVMGDNRDNSLDSRFEGAGVGLLPVEYLVGRADFRLFSLDFSRAEDGVRRHGGSWFSTLR